MNRLIVTFSLLVALLAPVAVLGSSAAAVDIAPDVCSGTGASDSSVCKDIKTQSNDGTNPIIKIIEVAINIISFVVGIAAVIGIVVSGIRFMTAGGDSGAVASARTALVYSLVGIAVVALAQLIVTLVLDNIG